MSHPDPLFDADNAYDDDFELPSDDPNYDDSNDFYLEDSDEFWCLLVVVAYVDVASVASCADGCGEYGDSVTHGLREFEVCSASLFHKVYEYV